MNIMNQHYQQTEFNFNKRKIIFYTQNNEANPLHAVQISYLNGNKYPICIMTEQIAQTAFLSSSLEHQLNLVFILNYSSNGM